MANWRNPGRAERVVIHEEGGELRQYWRLEDQQGNVSWCEDEPAAGSKNGAAISTADLLKALESSLTERRRSSRGLKFRL